MNPVGDEQITVDDTAGGVSLTIPTSAQRCQIDIHTADIYYTFDAAAPAAGNGNEALAGETIDIMGNGRSDMRGIMSQVRMLRQGSTSATAKVQYYT